MLHCSIWELGIVNWDCVAWCSWTEIDHGIAAKK